jgi:hypothetical protein
VFSRVAQRRFVFGAGDREFIERWRTWRGNSLEQVDAGVKGTGGVDSYVAEVCWKASFDVDRTT